MWRQLHPKLLAERKLQVLKLRGSICRAWTPTQLEILWNPTGPEKGSGEGLLSASHANAENHPSSAGVSRSVPQTAVSSAQVGDSQSRNFPQPHCPLGNSDRNRVTVDPTALTSKKEPVQAGSNESQRWPETEREPRARLSDSFHWTWTTYLKKYAQKKCSEDKNTYDFIFFWASSYGQHQPLMGLGIQAYGTGVRYMHIAKDKNDHTVRQQMSTHFLLWFISHFPHLILQSLLFYSGNFFSEIKESQYLGQPHCCLQSLSAFMITY